MIAIVMTIKGDQPGLPGAFDGPGGIEENETVGVNDRGAPGPRGAVVKGGLGERSCDSLLGEALNDGVADTRLLLIMSGMSRTEEMI